MRTTLAARRLRSALATTAVMTTVPCDAAPSASPFGGIPEARAVAP